MALTDKLTAIGDAVRGKTGESEKLTLDGMAEKIRSMPAPMQKITISGNISGLFSEKFMELYNSSLKDYIEFKDVQTCYEIIPSTDNLDQTLGVGYYDGHADVKDLSNITLNFRKGYYSISNCMFAGAKYLEKLPTLVNFAPNSLNRFFYACESLREIPESFYKDWDIGGVNQSSMLYNCRKLRKAPIKLLKKLSEYPSKGNPIDLYTYACFGLCKKIPEVLNFPFPKYISTYRTYSNAFDRFLYETYSLGRFTFEAEAEDTVHELYDVCILDFTTEVGYMENLYSKDYDLFDTNKEIKNAETYANLKDDPDSWTRKLEYCKYNKTSAVETINSLPTVQKADTSSNITFTIKFKGEAGSATDGGAINTMTEEEIAVATSRGWTVTFK